MGNAGKGEMGKWGNGECGSKSRREPRRTRRSLRVCCEEARQRLGLHEEIGNEGAGARLPPDGDSLAAAGQRRKRGMPIEKPELITENAAETRSAGARQSEAERKTKVTEGLLRGKAPRRGLNEQMGNAGNQEKEKGRRGMIAGPHTFGVNRCETGLVRRISAELQLTLARDSRSSTARCKI